MMMVVQYIPGDRQDGHSDRASEITGRGTVGAKAQGGRAAIGRLKEIGQNAAAYVTATSGIGEPRRGGGRVRVNAQLIDAETDAHLWAERFDGSTEDLFLLQDEITSRIAVALNLELIAAEAARPTAHPDALDYVLRARAAASVPPTRATRAKRITMLERALALDPGYADAQSYLAEVLAGRVITNMTDTAEADVSRAEELAGRALAASPRSPLAHHAKGQVLRAQRRYAEAIPEYETVLALDRNWVYALFALGQCKLFTGSIEETIPLIERAIRLSPRDPQLSAWYHEVGRVHLLQSRTDDAVVWLERARNANPSHPNFSPGSPRPTRSTATPNVLPQSLPKLAK
jgi:tetratricopeptide (TPR) repeat protein